MTGTWVQSEADPNKNLLFFHNTMEIMCYVGVLVGTQK